MLADMNHPSPGTHPTDAIIGSAPAIDELRRQISRLAGFDSVRSPHVPTVLICGETGTGKGLVARTLHDSGPRREGPFIDINCAAIPETMLEAEIFGFEEGAFTDARRAKPGLFEAAEGGTLFLDEIDSCSLALQSKLLKAIEDKSVRRLGAIEALSVDTKLVAATQRDLAGLVADGRFRADLYHRLAVVVLNLPRLEERRQDIVLLARHYLRQYADAHGLDTKRVTESAATWLTEHSWPGNVRELSHLMERVTLLATAGDLDSATLERLAVPPTGQVRQAPPPEVSEQPPGESDSSDEVSHIREALHKAGGNVAAAARLLGIGRNALRYRMRRHGIERPDITPAPPVAAPQPPAPKPQRAGAAPERKTGAGPASWEEKTAAVLAIELILASAGEERWQGEPWTIAKRWNQRIADFVGGFGGRVLQSTPTRVIAVFGVPRALEQTPQRAVQAALAIRRLHDETLRSGGGTPEIRIAGHLGTVHVDSSADALTGALLPVGDTLALPERLLAHTDDGELLVSPPIARRVASSCELQERALGQAGPSGRELRAYSVRGQKRSAAVDSGESRFVGRRRELAFLNAAFQSAKESNGQVAFIVGDAGIGKSRLLNQFRASLVGEDHRWIEGRCTAYGSTTAFLPIIDAMRRYFDIDDRDDEAAANAKIDAGTDNLDEDVAWTTPFLRNLLSLSTDDSVAELDSGRRRSETFEALKVRIMHHTDLRPVVLVVEDLHWIDTASEELINFLADTIPTMRALLICTYRPGYEHRLGDRSYHQRITLSPLSDEDAASMAQSNLGVASLPDAARTLITRKAEGNPFFVEEITASLLEEGSLKREGDAIVLTCDSGDLEIPETIQDVLLARIDRLAPDSRRAIQVASVIGREFALRLLERASEAGEHLRGEVEELRSLELIYEKAMHPELAYMFKHALTHDVAYNSVQQERRIQLHRLIGLTIEELYADRISEHYETLAHHFSEGRDWRKALSFHAKAAAKAADAHANHSVVHHSREGLKIAATMGESIGDDVVCELEERLALALFYLSEFSESGKAYERSAARAADSATRVHLLSSAGLSFLWAHEYEDAARLLESAGALAESTGDQAGQAVVTYFRGNYAGIIEADMEGYERHCNRAIELERASGSDVAAAVGCFSLAELYEWTGRYRETIAAADRGIELGKKLKLSHLIIWPMWFGGKARCCLGDYGKAIEMLRAASEICERIGDRAWNSRMLNTLGWVYAEIGAHDIALDLNQRAAAIARDFGDPEIIANSEINLALNHLHGKDLGRAQSLVEPIVESLERSTDPWMRWRFSLHALNARARIAIANKELDQALALADRQISGASQHLAPKIEARATTLRGELLLALDRRDEALQTLAAAAALAERIEHRGGTVAALALAAEAHRRNGDRGESEALVARVRSMLHQSANSLGEQELRQRLLAAST